MYGWRVREWYRHHARRRRALPAPGWGARPSSRPRPAPARGQYGIGTMRAGGARSQRPVGEHARHHAPDPLRHAGNAVFELWVMHSRWGEEMRRGTPLGGRDIPPPPAGAGWGGGVLPPPAGAGWGGGVLPPLSRTRERGRDGRVPYWLSRTAIPAPLPASPPLATAMALQPLLPPISYFLPPISYFLPPISYFLPPISYFLPPISYFLPPISYLLLPISYFLPPISYLLLPTSYLLSPTSYLLLPTSYLLPPIFYLLSSCHAPRQSLYCTVAHRIH
jgi:hypothetical protein